MPPPVRSSQPTQTTAAPRQTATTTARNPGAWLWPVPGTRITQGFRSGHSAVDVGLPVGSPLIAPTEGKVIRAGWDSSGYGNLVVLETRQGLQVFLGHLNQFAVRAGDLVKRGQLLGYTGNTGNSTGPHLHYEIRQGSGRVDPLKIPYTGQTSYPQSGTQTSARPASGQLAPAPGPGQSASVPTSGQSAPTPAPGQSAPTPAPGQSAPTSSFRTVINGVPVDIPLPKLHLNNAIVIILGVILIGAGISGLIYTETGKAILAPVTEEIKKVLE